MTVPCLKVLFVSLGCDKNRVDSEKMLGLLVSHGFEITDDEYTADVIIVNTCCFIAQAKQESIDCIIDLGRRKSDARCKVLIVTGCMAQRYASQIQTLMPEVDAIIGTTGFDRIANVVNDVLKGRKEVVLEDLSRTVLPKGRRVLTSGSHYAYLKIAEGCDKHCTYCAIPLVRGPYRSIPKEALIYEAENLSRAGVRELILVAQETTLYGTDLYGRKCLHDLIRSLAGISGIRWIRVLYCYPEEIYEDLITCMREETKFVHYLDIPVQHASDAVLKRMGRHTTREDLRRIIERLRDRVSDIILRTTIITGFPGETRDDFEDLCCFIDEIEFNHLGAFVYSREEGTPAFFMDGQIDDDTKQSRRDEVMELQQSIAFELNQKMMGREMEVLIDGKVVREMFMSAAAIQMPRMLTESSSLRQTGSL